MISIKNVSFSYIKDKPVLKNISFDIKDNECVILLGPNGVGKSTLINLILGANKLQSGDILFDDISLKELKPNKKAEYLSYVSQLIYGNSLTVEDTILLGRLPFYKLYPRKIDKELVKNVLEEFNLINMKDKQTNEISGGERQKVSIARGFIQNSKTIIFDEPTSNLDVKAQQEVMSLIKSKKGLHSFLISIHDINQALNIGDKFIFLKDGEIKYQVNKDEITETLLKDVYGINSQIITKNGRRYVLYENE